MSKHWDPGRGGWAGQWDRHRWRVAGRKRRRRLRRPPGPPRFTLADIRLMLLAGLFLGLLLWQGPRLWPTPGPAAVPPNRAPAASSNPYAEADRSREILGAQEGAPPPVNPPIGGPLYAAGPSGGGPVRVIAGSPARTGGPVRVIDGDTFEQGGMRIRIADIDTPEVHGRCASETALAARATGRMRALLAAGPFELHALADGRDEDRYGRKLRIVTRGGRSLGDVLVAEGLARTWTGRREPWC
jgi:endonuclease YncB( thermonuclease family)